MITDRDVEAFGVYLALMFLAMLGVDGFVRGHREYIPFVCYWIRKLKD